MKPFPFFKQHDAMDCGPTCLRMVAKHYGKTIAANKINELTLISKEGVSLLGISDAAEQIGFRTISVELSFEKLINEAPLPCIVHWEQNHFVVVLPPPPGEGFGQDLTLSLQLVLKRKTNYSPPKYKVAAGCKQNVM